MFCDQIHSEVRPRISTAQWPEKIVAVNIYASPWFVHICVSHTYHIVVDITCLWPECHIGRWQWLLFKTVSTFESMTPMGIFKETSKQWPAMLMETKAGYFKQKHYIFLSLTTCFLCLNLTRPETQHCPFQNICDLQKLPTFFLISGLTLDETTDKTFYSSSGGKSI